MAAKKKTTRKVIKQRRVSSEKKPFVIGVGASAGGLEAIRVLVSHLKSIEDAAMVIVQHLSPQHRSLLVDLIARETRLTVKEAHDKESLVANTIYITPPNTNILIESGKIAFAKPVSKIGPKPSVDIFLESLADEFGERAVGVILSGTGSDGTRGVRAIRAAGGFTLAQSTESAKYDGMPSSAIQSGAVDFVGDPEVLASQLSNLNHLVSQEHTALSSEQPLDPYRKVLKRLKSQLGTDFSVYKPSTIKRRLHRRMTAHRIERIEDYASLLERDSREVANLFQDLLISVTCFFRDSAAFSELEKNIRKQVRNLTFSENTYRAWVAGCATGEEAYTIAMILREILDEDPKMRIQIFATDLSDTALAVARRGVYPEAALIKVPKSYRNKYFTQLENGFQIKKSLRDIVVFAKQDLIKDPPFLRLDLITCRNVLIYFNHDIQDRLFQVFHYALNLNGLLLLGKSESISKSENLFKAINQNVRLFLRGKAISASSAILRSVQKDEVKQKARHQRAPVDPKVLEKLVGRFAPNSVVLDGNYNIKRIFGDMADLLKMSEGDISHSLLRYIHTDLRSETTTLLHRAKKEKKRVLGRQREIMIHGKLYSVQLSCLPLKLEGETDYIIEVFKNSVANPKTVRSHHSKSKHSPHDEYVREIEQELAATKEHLQTVVEELETSNEELQALNEELQSANEELQSANEELETSNEELHATNEELTTLNEELNVKTNEANLLNEQLENVQAAITYPVLVVDSNMNILRFNEASNAIFKPTELAVGKNLRLVSSKYDLKAAFEAVENCLRNQTAAGMQIHSNGNFFELQVRPLSGTKGTHGAVIVLADITEHIVALNKIRESEGTLQAILRNTPAIVSLKDAAGKYEFVNDRFAEFIEMTPHELVGKTDEDIFSPDVARSIRERDYECLTKRSSVTFEEKVVLANGKDSYFISAKVPLLDSKNSPRSVCTISLDMTERKRAEEIIFQQQEQLLRTGKLTALGEMAAGIAHELNTPLNAIQAHVDTLEVLAEENSLDKTEALSAAQGIEKLVTTISHIITNLRNIARMENHQGFVQKDVSALMREVMSICELHMRNHGVRSEVVIPSHDVVIECQPVQLMQVLINLVNNAVDAIDQQMEKWVRIEVLDDQDFVEISVVDSGHGIPKDIADKIMTPFFSTKEPGKGTGMGLSLAQTIVNIHSGKLLLDSKSKNTSFKIILPKRQVKNVAHNANVRPS